MNDMELSTRQEPGQVEFYNFEDLKMVLEAELVRYQSIADLCEGIEFPLSCDYTWILPPERYDLTFELAKHDIDICIKLDLPFVTVAHVDPVYDGEGIRMLKDIYAYAKEAAAKAGKELEFVTLEQLADGK